MNNSYKNQKVLIFGLGTNQCGVGAAKFFAKQGAMVRVTDLKTARELKSSLDLLKKFKNIEYVLGKHREQDIDWADLIIRNPAIKPDSPYLKYALEKGKQVEMDLGIFLQFVKKEQIIGITGTKGKSTTASLIYEILHQSLQVQTKQFNVIFAGNIGKSVLDTLPNIKKNSLIILELSSFQLQAFDTHKFPPKYAVITNIYPDHINYHGSMKKYIDAKKIISKHQAKDNFLFIRKGDQVTDKKSFLNEIRSKIIRFSPKDLPKNFQANLVGQHNLENISASLAVAKIFGVKKEIVLKTVQNFSGVKFRLELIYNKRGFKIYNDSTATNPAATIQALKTLPNSIVIVGGVNKNLEYKNLAKALEKYSRAIYFLEGDATKEIRKHLKYRTFPTYTNLEKLLKTIRADFGGGTILFSPGAASFNLFQNEFDRGEKFNQAVKKSFK